jgi:hypothetical protein
MQNRHVLYKSAICYGSMQGAEPKHRQWRIKLGESPVSKGALRLKEQGDHCELRLHFAPLRSK